MSQDEHITQPRKKPGPKPKLPKVTIAERRLANPFGSPSVAVTLKEGGPWEVRWVASGLRAGRLHDMIQNKGWDYVRPEEIDGTPDEYGLQAKDNRLVRGEHGGEVLMKMPKALYDQIAQRKAELNLKGLGAKAIRESAAQDTAKVYGSQAGDAVYDHMKVTATKGEDAELMELESESA